MFVSYINQYIHIMFYLRKINSDGVETNVTIGKSYHFICRFASPKKFRQVYKDHHGIDHVDDLDKEANDYTKTITSFVIGPGKKNSHDIMDGDKVYIMTGDGKTFATISQ